MPGEFNPLPAQQRILLDLPLDDLIKVLRQIEVSLRGIERSLRDGPVAKL